MDNAFYTSGISDYQAALQEYANELNNEKIETDTLDKPIEEYNEKLREVTEPLGVSLIHEPVAAAAKAGVKKLLGKTTQSASRAITRAARGDLQGARSALTDPLREAQGQLRSLAERGRVVGSQLSDGTRGAVNSLRAGRAIRAPASADPIPSPAGAGSIGDSPVPRVFRPGGDIPAPPPRSAPGFADAPLDPTFDAQRQAGITEALRGEPIEVDAFAPSPTTIGTRVIPDRPSLLSVLRGDTADPFSSPRGLSQARGLTQAAAADPEADATLSSALRTAARGAGRAAANVSRAAGALGAEADAGLESAALTADVAAGAEGGANPIADVVAGALGIGTLLSGIFGGKAEPEQHLPEFIPSAQFGI